MIRSVTETRPGPRLARARRRAVRTRGKRLHAVEAREPTAS
jgi:hypothetical protein